MLRGFDNGWDEPFQANTLLDLNCSDPEQSSILENLITSQAGSWEVLLKIQWEDGQSFPSRNFLIWPMNWEMDPQNLVVEGNKREKNHGKNVDDAHEWFWWPFCEEVEHARLSSSEEN